VLCDSVNYGNVTENGFEVIRATFVFVTDKVFKHVFSYPSADYEDIKAGDKDPTPIVDGHGGTVSTPRLLDADGAEIPNPPGGALKTPFIVSGGAHVEKAFDPLTIPESIP
jgi:hypothetical protein